MRLRNWVQASRPLAQINLAVPLVLGQAAAWFDTGSFSWGWLGASLIWSALDQLCIVYANDVSDHETDTGGRTLISGGSGVLQDGRLSVAQLRMGMWVAIVFLIAWSAGLGVAGRVWTPVYAVAALAMLWAYSFLPLRLGHRGGGELVQGVAVGVGLTSLGYYLQGGGFIAPVWIVLPATLVGVCGNVLTAMPDLDADTGASKRTFVVQFGMKRSLWFVLLGLTAAAVGASLWTPGLHPPMKWALVIPGVMISLLAVRQSTPFRTALAGSFALNVILVSWIVVLFAGR